MKKVNKKRKGSFAIRIISFGIAYAISIASDIALC